MLKIEFAKSFKKSYKKLNQKEKELFENISLKLANNETLEAKYKDHALKGDFIGFRECHLRPDLLLIYQIQDDKLVLYCLDIGSHSELFQ